MASDVLPCAEALVAPQALMSRADETVSRQDPQAVPRNLAMRVWAEQVLDPPGVMKALRACLSGRDFDLEALEAFHGRLREASPEAKLADRL
ncbi:hypothetical protein [Antarctobacter sp.]|uniref:hypothetical protein n=1 Tax=Antarctobacter sp. TaxID=1872577 RepID=UPI002B27A9E9|nr:hypothetical protein [Antarctobacter sp.]